MERNRLVTQEDEWGCGVACVASKLGIKYDEAKKRLEEYKGSPIDPGGLELEPIMSVLQDAGICVLATTDLTNFPLGSIVFLSETWGRYKGSGHYLLKTERGWMDPWSNMPHMPRESVFLSSLSRDKKISAHEANCVTPHSIRRNSMQHILML